MQLFGLVSFAYMWARMAKVAQDKIAAMQARAAALDELMLSGALSAGEGHDDIDRQLEALSVSNTVETELAELRAELGSGSLGELEAGTETA